MKLFVKDLFYETLNGAATLVMLGIGIMLGMVLWWFFDHYPSYIPLVLVLMLFGKFVLTKAMNWDWNAEKAVNQKSNIKEFKKVQLFNISEIGRKYKAISLVQSSEKNEEAGLLELQKKAFELNADAIVNIKLEIVSDVSGDIKADTLITPGGGGKIQTKKVYHYMGAAVKYV